MPDPEEALKRQIAAEGPIPVADYMAAANAHYYASRDPLGAAGDFTTAPEVSQMFGELIGLWLADMWLRAGGLEKAHYVELGPGRGTLAADALRAMRGAGLDPPVELVETSPVLRAMQAERLPSARWHDTIGTLPADGPLLIVANEFFDALPIRQFAERGGTRRALCVDHRDGRFVREAPAEGERIVEDCPAALEIALALAERLARQGGAALVIDYGHERSGTGDTLQAVSAHAFADPWEGPGSRDLTAHVDFEALGHAARKGGARIFGPRTQGSWLRAMGINLRAASLAKAAPERTEEIVAARERLTAPEAMGTLFKALAIVAPRWPEPEGF
jgi:NADH dehydrogenase [ubiquinone] 1 alpha subcomplex assembly factor 7